MRPLYASLLTLALIGCGPSNDDMPTHCGVIPAGDAETGLPGPLTWKAVSRVEEAVRMHAEDSLDPRIQDANALCRALKGWKIVSTTWDKMPPHTGGQTYCQSAVMVIPVLESDKATNFAFTAIAHEYMHAAQLCAPRTPNEDPPDVADADHSNWYTDKVYNVIWAATEMLLNQESAP
jgi:hypothetical protein